MKVSRMSSSSVYGYIGEAVRVKVKKCDGSLPVDYRKFSIDPQITSFEVLQSIIAKAFDIKGVFTVSYKALDDYGQEALLPLLSDWDLDAAFLNASEPCLSLQVDIKPMEEQPESWVTAEPMLDMSQRDVFGTIEIPRSQISENKIQNRLPGLIMNRMEKTLNIFQRAFNLGEDQVSTPLIQPSRPPLADAEFRKYLDPIGQISQLKELRSAIYYGGVEPSLRKVVWKHILNVYPEGMSGKERMDYIKRKTYEYETLRSSWRDMVQNGQVSEELSYVTSMVRKDVLRTDRHHTFYAGSDDNQNIASLFNILTTYSLNHPSVSYCQGMSDLASPLLVTMGDEAHAYICFCALMTRLKPNFMLDGITMTLKFQHLTEGLMYYDPEFHAYLKLHQAEDLLFCYRWLLLEMKREFAFDDALHMLEVLWSSLQPRPPDTELPLFESEFCSNAPGLTPPPISPLLKTPRENPYTKVCALRRQSSSVSLNSLATSRRMRTISHRQNQSLDETILARQNRLRKQGHVKPFSSLDDNCVQLLSAVHVTNSRSISPMNAHSESDALGTMKKRVNTVKLSCRNGALSSSTGNLIEISNKRNLSKRLAEETNTSSLIQLGNDEYSQKENDETKINKIHKGRVVKNLNEFLNFASKPRVMDRLGSNPRQRSQCSSISESDVTSGPVITVTKSPVDEVGSDAVQSDVDSNSDKSSNRQNSSPSLSCATSPISPNVFESQPSDDLFNDESSPDDSTDYYPMTTSMTRELRLELDNLDRKVFGLKFEHKIVQKESFQSSNVDASCSSVKTDRILSKEESTVTEVTELKSQIFRKDKMKTEPEVFIWENPLKCPTTPDEQADLDFDESSSSGAQKNCEPRVKTDDCVFWSSPDDAQQSTTSKSNAYVDYNGFAAPTTCEEATEVSNFLTRSANNIKAASILNSLRSGNAVSQILRSPARSQSTFPLPAPEEFGGGNPFLMFLCLTLLRQHRDYIIRSGMDYNEMAMHFDKMVRKHNLARVLDEARHMFASYLKQHSSHSKQNVQV